VTKEESMKKVLLLVMLGIMVILVAFIGCSKGRSVKNVPRVSKEYLKAKLGSPDVVLIDVRAKTDWDKSNEKITGAVRMEPETVDTWSETLPKDKEIVLYCA
jgi:hypothetical protein